MIDELPAGLQLRELRREDLDEMDNWPRYHEPDLQWANLDLGTSWQKEAWYRREHHDPTRRRFAIVVDGAVVGVLGLRNIDYRRGVATLGIRLSPAQVGRGYGTEAIKSALSYAFRHLRLRQVDLDVAEDNHRALRCYLKCGFRVVGRRQDHGRQFFLDMSITATEFGGVEPEELSS